ncbi:hypothetical protein KA107_01735 [Candidatus Pacearchaeota archaeon]|nr:hypothetical protein [Candidatus Pacearchaeota archaeon]
MREQPRKYLFVCNTNFTRSKMAAEVFTELLKSAGYSVGRFEDRQGYDFYLSSAGIKVDRYSSIRVKQFDISLRDFSDIIFAMDETVRASLMCNYFVPPKKIVDIFVHYDPASDHEGEEHSFREDLKSRLERYVPKKK